MVLLEAKLLTDINNPILVHIQNEGRKLNPLEQLQVN